MARKEKATIDLGDAAAAFDVKLANGKKSKDKADQLTIDSPVIEVAGKTASKKVNIPVVDKCVEIAQAIENLEAEQSIYEAELIQAASTAKTAAADDDDNFVKTVNVAGTNAKIQIQFRDAYSKMDMGMKAPLVQIFGDKYPIMFAEDAVYNLRDGKIDELKSILGDRFDAFFDTDKSLKPTKDFQQTFFTLRKTFKPDQLAVIEKVKAATQQKPAVKYPK
jgi:hypothetical protein